MGATFVVTLREAFEAALLLGIVYTYLDKIGARAQAHYVTIGGALGLLASVAMGVALTYLSGPLLDVGPDLVATVVIFGAVALLTWHGWWMRHHASAVRGDIERRLEEARANRRLWIVGLIAFTGVFREGAETVLFLWGLLAEAASGPAGIAGGALGVAVAAVLGWLIFHGGRRISLRLFFAFTSALLLLIAAGLFSTGLGKLQAFGWLPGGDLSGTPRACSATRESSAECSAGSSAIVRDPRRSRSPAGSSICWARAGSSSAARALGIPRRG